MNNIRFQGEEGCLTFVSSKIFIKAFMFVAMFTCGWFGFHGNQLLQNNQHPVYI